MGGNFQSGFADVCYEYTNSVTLNYEVLSQKSNYAINVCILYKWFCMLFPNI